MTQPLLADVKTDRLSFEFDALDFEFDALDFDGTGVEALEVVHLGLPQIEETRMCAQCVGECKVF